MPRPIGEHVGLLPLTYNRFAGNPPSGVDPADLFEQEMGVPYPVRVVTEVTPEEVDPSLLPPTTLI